jgi:hypothetical protein
MSRAWRTTGGAFSSVTSLLGISTEDCCMAVTNTRPSPDVIPMPRHWFDLELPRIATPADCERILVTQSPLLRSRLTKGVSADAEFFERLHDAIAGPAAHAILGFPGDVPAAAAAALLATWFGVGGDAVHTDIGGTVSHVVSGVGHRHDQAWHTDSTPWAMPNKLSILGLISIPTVTPAPTEILPLVLLEQSLLRDAEALLMLRGTPIDWRRNFPDLSDLRAPILDPSTPRWVWPVVEVMLGEFPREFIRSIEVLLQTLNSVSHYAPRVDHGQLLLFDNHRALHRGPPLEATAGRELVRVKIGGRPIW